MVGISIITIIFLDLFFVEYALSFSLETMKQYIGGKPQIGRSEWPPGTETIYLLYLPLIAGGIMFTFYMYKVRDRKKWYKDRRLNKYLDDDHDIAAEQKRLGSDNVHIIK